MPSKQDLIDLAVQFLPILKFADGERFFPVRAEYWLAHQSTENFADHEKGSAVYLYDPADPIGWKSAPPAVPRNQISLDSTAGVNFIADQNWTARDNCFLDFGGWQTPPARDGGDFGYSEDAFSSVSNPPGNPPPPSTNLGVMGAGPVGMVAPETYAEIVPADELVPATIDPSVRESLRGALALNYYYLYPILHHQEGGPDFGSSAEGKVHEGQ